MHVANIPFSDVNGFVGVFLEATAMLFAILPSSDVLVFIAP
jgi:membrane protein DedA with SNARE-associated domain